MKSLNLLPVFTRPTVFAAAISIVAAFAFVSSASAGEKNFDALGGVTAEALTPAAMDAIQGTSLLFVMRGSIVIVGPIGIGASRSLTIQLKNKGGKKVIWH